MKKIFFAFMITLISFSCNDDADREGYACTEQYESIGVQLQYPDGTPVPLDSFKVFWGDRDITHKYTAEEFAMAQKAGTYSLVNDTYQEELEGLSVNVHFLAYKDGHIRVNEEYLVGADECHVIYLDHKPLLYTIHKFSSIECTGI